MQSIINLCIKSALYLYITFSSHRCLYFLFFYISDPQGAAVQTHHFHMYNKRESSATLEKKLSRDSLKVHRYTVTSPVKFPQ